MKWIVNYLNVHYMIFGYASMNDMFLDWQITVAMSTMIILQSFI